MDKKSFWKGVLAASVAFFVSSAFQQAGDKMSKLKKENKELKSQIELLTKEEPKEE